MERGRDVVLGDEVRERVAGGGSGDLVAAVAQLGRDPGQPERDVDAALLGRREDAEVDAALARARLERRDVLGEPVASTSAQPEPRRRRDVDVHAHTAGEIAEALGALERSGVAGPRSAAGGQRGVAIDARDQRERREAVHHHVDARLARDREREVLDDLARAPHRPGDLDARDRRIGARCPAIAAAESVAS